MSHRSSLLENNSNGNPFEILQTIPIQTEPTTDDDNIFAVPKPRESAKSKRSRNRNPSVKKRSSAPSQSLATSITDATQKLKQQQAFPTQVQTAPVSAQPRQQAYSAAPAPSATDDLLGIFSGGGSSQPARPALSATSYSQPVPNANPFDFFDPLAGQDAHNLFAGVTPSSQPSSVATSKRSSMASSVGDAELFDPNMWISSSSTDFFASEAEKQEKVRQEQSTVGLTMAGFSEEKDDDDDDEDDDESSTDGSEEPAETPRRKTVDRENEEDTKDRDDSPDPPTNCLIEMHRGTALLKYPRRHGFPHFKHVQLSMDNRRIQWFSKRKSLEETCIRIADVREIRTGQKTETFQKFHQEVLEKASFSIVFGDNYRTFDVVAKSTDECNMWVLSLRKLKHLQETGTDLSTLTYLDVGIAFKDRNRPKSREGSGNFVRANNSRQLKIDPVAMKQIERDMQQMDRNYKRICGMVQKPNISLSAEFDNISQVLSELEERIDELKQEVNNTRDTDMSKRDVWRANVDLTAIGEKTEVMLKVNNVHGKPKK